MLYNSFSGEPCLYAVHAMTFQPRAMSRFWKETFAQNSLRRQDAETTRLWPMTGSEFSLGSLQRLSPHMNHGEGMTLKLWKKDGIAGT
jgi:hypothetical protein